jgi:5-methylcytosine-specific restriction endonuclease McrA
VHHVVAVSKGGSDDIRNLVSLCPDCHLEAHGGKFRKAAARSTQTRGRRQEGSA